MTILISAVASSLRVVFLSSSSYTEYEADKKRVSPPTDSTNHQTHAKKKIPGPKSQHLPLVGFFKHSIPFFVVWRLGGVLALRIWRYGTSLDFPLKKPFLLLLLLREKRGVRVCTHSSLGEQKGKEKCL